MTVPSAVPNSPPAAGLVIRTLGPLEVTVDGVPLAVDTRKALAVLALVAVDRRPFAREELATMLWPESDDESARGALRRTLSVLRASLGARWLRVDRATVSLDREGSWLDLDVLAVVAAGSDHATREIRPPGERSIVEAAAALARGPFLAGFSLRDSVDFDDWRATRAVAVERQVAEVLDHLSTMAAAAGDLEAAVTAASRRLELDPLDEASHRRLMTLLARSGDRAGAIRRYRACVAVLERELGVPPLAETTSLYEAIRDGSLVVLTPTEPQRSVVSPPPAPSPGRDAASVPAGARRIPFVGRDAELTAILEAHAAAASDGRVVAVVGEAGIGKSRLLEEAAAVVASRGGRTLLVRAYASESGIAYGPIAELLRMALALPDAGDRMRALPKTSLHELDRLVPVPDALLAGPGRRARPAERALGEGAGTRARLLDAIVSSISALVAGPSPAFVAIEDLQWADEASREVLAYLARRLSGRRVVLALTWRPEDLDDLGAAFAATLETLPRTIHVSLHPLDRAAVERLVVGSGRPAALTDALLESSEGLPLYIVEAMSAQADGETGAGPAGATPSVRSLLRERLARVSETAAQLLSAAAVIGRSFDLGLVRATSGRSEEETIGGLEELVRRGLVREATGAAGSFDFAHARLRDAAYEGTGLARRRLLHRRVAELLRTEPGRREDPARLALIAAHERAAGREAEAAEAYRVAGLAARALFAHREAAADLETALALGHPDVAAIQVALGEIRIALGDYPGAVAALEAAAALSDPGDIPGIDLRLGRAHARRGDLGTSASHLDAALEVLEGRADGDRTVLAMALVERAEVARRAGGLAVAADLAGRGLVVAEADDDRVGTAAALRLLGSIARDQGALETARESLGRSLAIAEAGGDTTAAVAARNALAPVLAAAGDQAAAIALLETALDACRRTGERHLEAAVENNLADQLREAGRRDEALAHLRSAVSIFAEVGGAPDEPDPGIWMLERW